MPQYAALIYEQGDPDWSVLDTPDKQQVMGEYGQFSATVAAVMRGGAALYPTTTATTVRVTGGKGGQVVTSDGPFAETKEVLTGFYLLECARPGRGGALGGPDPGGVDGHGRGAPGHRLR